MTPKIFFYVSSYSPTPIECRIIKSFVQAGFAPGIDAITNLGPEVKEFNGLFWSIGSEEIEYCDQYNGEKIFMLVIFDEHVDIESAKSYYSGLLGLCTLSRKGMCFDDFKPKPIQTCISGSEFESPTEILPDERSVYRIEGGPNQDSVNRIIDSIRR